MDDEAFLDEIYKVWARTTGAADMYYMPVEYEDRSGRYRVYAVGQDDQRKLVAESMSDQDSDFLTAIHGCLADLVRRLHTAIDESARLDCERDEQEVRIAELEIERGQLLNSAVSWEERCDKLEAKLSDERGYSAYLQCDINDLDAEIIERDREIADLLAKIPEELL